MWWRLYKYWPRGRQQHWIQMWIYWEFAFQCPVHNINLCAFPIRSYLQWRPEENVDLRCDDFLLVRKRTENCYKASSSTLRLKLTNVKKIIPDQGVAPALIFLFVLLLRDFLQTLCFQRNLEQLDHLLQQTSEPRYKYKVDNIKYPLWNNKTFMIRKEIWKTRYLIIMLYTRPSGIITTFVWRLDWMRRKIWKSSI